MMGEHPSEHLGGIISMYGVGPVEVIRQAMLKRQQISLLYRGHVRHCCPHAIGTRAGRPYVLMFQFSGRSNNPMPPGGTWRCMDLEEITQISVMNGRWQGGPAHSRPRGCLDTVEQEVR